MSASLNMYSSTVYALNALPEATMILSQETANASLEILGKEGSAFQSAATALSGLKDSAHVPQGQLWSQESVNLQYLALPTQLQ